MKGTINVWKGRLNEAAGALIGNNKLRIKGRKDQAIGRFEEDVEKNVQKAKDAGEKIVDHAKDVAEKGVDKAKTGKS